MVLVVGPGLLPDPLNIYAYPQMVHDALDRATESELACATYDYRFWFIQVEIELL
jgi:hypothetical protein